MKTVLLSALLCVLMSVQASAQAFDKYFTNRTLRVDYQFCGDARQQSIYLDKLSALPGWAGRQKHLDELPLLGNGQVTMRNAADGRVIYRTSFSSLFQEWLTTDEARSTAKSFQAVVLLPFPRQAAEIEVTLMDARHEVRAQLVHTIDPQDILIHHIGHTHITPHRYLLQSGKPEKCIDVAILAEGYTEAEMELFYQDAAAACQSLFSHEPFRSMKKRFNVVAVASPSADSGVSIPRLEQWKHTAFGSHFSTFYSDRYLTTLQVGTVHDALAGIPYEHIIILANTDEYGGGGIYNSYTLTTAHHPMFRPVVVHEFGHSFGGLGDEYFYENDVMTDTYPLDIEPWEPNITTLKDFHGKWENLIKEGTPLPTPSEQATAYPVGLYEGGGYSAKGIYRPADNCRMRTNQHPEFCPACRQALERLIEFYTK